MMNTKNMTFAYLCCMSSNSVTIAEQNLRQNAKDRL